MTPSFAAIYRFRLKPGLEQPFIAAWSEVTRYYLGHGSLGSRLHSCGDGIWYAYAQWPSREARERAFADPSIASARAIMREAILDELPDIELTTVADHIVAASK